MNSHPRSAPWLHALRHNSPVRRKVTQAWPTPRRTSAAASSSGAAARSTEGSIASAAATIESVIITLTWRCSIPRLFLIAVMTSLHFPDQSALHNSVQRRINALPFRQQLLEHALSFVGQKVEALVALVLFPPLARE